LHDASAPVRETTAYVLGELAWQADELIPALRARFTRERSRAVRISIALAVAHLTGYTPKTPHAKRVVTWLRRRYTDSDPALRLAAVAMAWRTGSARPRDL